MLRVYKAIEDLEQIKWYLQKKTYGELKRASRLLQEKRFFAFLGYLLDISIGKNPYIEYRISKSDGRFIECEVLGNYLLIDPMDEGIGRELIQHEIHEPVSTRTYKSQLRKLRMENSDIVVLDIGANIGYYALLAACTLRDNDRIHAIEPVPKNIDILTRNISRNGYDKMIDVHRGAVGDVNGLAELELATHSNRHRIKTSDLTNANPHDFRVIETPIWTIDKFIGEQNIEPEAVKVIRMDLEGYEAKVFDGMSSLLNANSSMLIHVELHPGEVTDKEDIIKILEKLERANFEIVTVSAVESKAKIDNFEDLKSFPAHWYELTVVR